VYTQGTRGIFFCSHPVSQLSTVLKHNNEHQTSRQVIRAQQTTCLTAPCIMPQPTSDHLTLQHTSDHVNDTHLVCWSILQRLPRKWWTSSSALKGLTAQTWMNREQPTWPSAAPWRMHPPASTPLCILHSPRPLTTRSMMQSPPRRSRSSTPQQVMVVCSTHAQDTQGHKQPMVCFDWNANLMLFMHVQCTLLLLLPGWYFPPSETCIGFSFAEGTLL